MTTQWRTPLIALCAACGLLIDCAQSPLADGGVGDETTNGITACVLTVDGAPAVGAAVRLRGSDWVVTPPALGKRAIVGADAYTDQSGRFQITGVTPGEYRVEVNDGKSAAVLLQARLDRGMNDLGTSSMAPWAAVSGRAGSDSGQAAPRFVQVCGMERLIPLDSAGAFTVADLPEGSYTFRVVASGQAATPRVIDSVQAFSGRTTAIGAYASWPLSKRIVLNTSPGGAGVSGDVSNFPLLVRLNATNFDFLSAGDSGHDLRFTQSDFAALPHEIEFWDKPGKAAAVWVRVPTVRGNNSGQFIYMFWGNQSAAAVSDPAAVFSTSEGYQGVWHLTEAVGQFRDATPNGNHSESGMVSQRAVPGIAGGSVELDGIDDYIDLGAHPSLAITGSLSVMAWIRLPDVTTDRTYGIVTNKFTFGDSLGYELKCTPSHRVPTSINPETYLDIWTSDSSRARSSVTVRLTANRWHLCAGTVENGLGHVYLDGTDVTYFEGKTGVGAEVQALRPAVSALRVGGIYGDPFWGGIDEIRVCARALSAEYLRLSYENQKPAQTLMQIK